MSDQDLPTENVDENSEVSSSYSKLMSGVKSIKKKANKATKKEKRSDEIQLIAEVKAPLPSIKEKLLPEHFVPDRSMNDFYCNLCDCHMDTMQMWNSHVSGKRHRNKVNGTREALIEEKVISCSEPPMIETELRKLDDPIVGLKYVREIKKSDPSLCATYKCFLCSANLPNGQSLIEHLRGSKHKLAYIKKDDPEGFKLIQGFHLGKEAVASLADEHAMKLEQKHGRGTMNVVIDRSKPKKRKVDKEVECKSTCSDDSLSIKSHEYQDVNFRVQDSRKNSMKIFKRNKIDSIKTKHPDMWQPAEPASTAQYSNPTETIFQSETLTTSIQNFMSIIPLLPVCVRLNVLEKLVPLDPTTVRELEIVKEVMNSLMLSVIKFKTMHPTPNEEKTLEDIQRQIQSNNLSGFTSAVPTPVMDVNRLRSYQPNVVRYPSKQDNVSTRTHQASFLPADVRGYPTGIEAIFMRGLNQPELGNQNGKEIYQSPFLSGNVQEYAPPSIFNQASFLSVNTRGREDVSARGREDVSARGREDMTARGRDDVSTRGRDNVSTRGRDNVSARGRDDVSSRGRDNLSARGQEDMPARGQGDVYARGRGDVYARGREDVLARRREDVLARGRDDVLARGRDDVLARGRDDVLARNAHISEYLAGHRRENVLPGLVAYPTARESLSLKNPSVNEESHRNATFYNEHRKVPFYEELLRIQEGKNRKF